MVRLRGKLTEGSSDVENSFGLGLLEDLGKLIHVFPLVAVSWKWQVVDLRWPANLTECLFNKRYDRLQGNNQVFRSGRCEALSKSGSLIP
jgi:hypothetical protein